MINRQDLCPNDPLAPGLIAAFDPQRLTQAVDRMWPAWEVNSASVVRAKYKPYEKALLSIVADCSDGTRRRLALRVLPPDRLQGQYERVLGTGHSSAVGLSQELGAVAWTFPADYRMPDMANLIDRDVLAVMTVPELAKRISPTATVDSWTIEVVQYAPEQSCTARLVLSYRDASGARDTQTFYGKYHAAGEAGDAAAALAQIEAAALTQSLDFCVAPIALQQDDLGLQWQAEARGRPIDVASLLTCNSTVMDRVAEAVMSLHNLPPILPSRGNRFDTTRLRDRLGVTACLSSDAQERVRKLVDRLQASKPDLTTRQQLCHGDLHPKNILAEGNVISFIDFDAALVAPPEFDVASFAAALFYHGALATLGDAEVHAVVRQWVDAYRDAGGRADPTRLNWFTAWCLLDERLYRCLTRLKPGRRELAERLIAICSELLASPSPRSAAHD